MLVLKDGHFRDAAELFEKVISLDPTHQASYVRLGSLYVKQQFSAALPWLERASRLNARDPQAFFHLGLAYDGLGRHEQALTAFRTSIELAPSSAAAHYNLGTLLLKVGDFRGALPRLQEAIRLNPQFSDALYNLAVVYALLGERENALQWLKQAIQLSHTLASEAQRDEHFRSLRSDPDFAAMTQP